MTVTVAGVHGPLHIHPETYFAVGFHQDDLILQLRPFVLAVHHGVKELGDLRAAVLRAAEQYPELAGFFHIVDGEIEESFGLREEYLFPHDLGINEIAMGNRESGRSFVLGAEELPVVERLMSLCGLGAADEPSLRDELDDLLVDKLLRDGLLRRGEPHERFRPSREPGIVRLQHASLLYRSETTGILVDPHFHSTFTPSGIDTFASRDMRELVDAILISHAHGDHFSLSTLMLFPRDTPIIVPRVARANLIGADMAQRLRAVGFTRVMDPEWFSAPLGIGDFEIDVLPFYGEQPLRDEDPRHPDLRNWGNTYYLKSPQYSSWFLIDSGDDPRGRMADVAKHVVSRHGGVDYLLSNLNIFRVGAREARPDYIGGSGHYWLALRPSQMARFPSLCGQPITLGPAGVAEVARIARPRRFLPYAHWWSAVGTRPDNEGRMVELLAQASDKLGARLDIVPWRVGDHFPAAE